MLHGQEVGVADRAGVVGVHHVGVRHLRGGGHLVIEPLHDLGIGHQAAMNYLEGHHAAHGLVPGLEDLAHHAFAQPFQDQVRLEHQLAGLAGEDLVDLVGAEPFAFDQFARQRLHVGETRRQRLLQLVELTEVEELIPLEDLDERGDGRRGHRRRLSSEKLRPFLNCKLKR